ncbi:hypothetical protein [Euzebya rosea]|uniref:hypothetical protein n=1 Tax=Euzebya rosea TaxID=2052804 RepID=UPI0013007BC3|nr:hypothetical protein [Euzebya rosea]
MIQQVTAIVGRPADEVNVLNSSGSGSTADKTGDTWVARWVGAGQRIEVWSQLAVNRRSRSLCGDPDLKLSSITATLVPDVLVCVADASGARIVVVDAKDTRHPVLKPGVVATTGSKYLWGLRVHHKSATTEVTGARIVTAATAPRMFSPAESKIQAVQASPDKASLSWVAVWPHP